MRGLEYAVLMMSSNICTGQHTVQMLVCGIRTRFGNHRNLIVEDCCGRAHCTTAAGPGFMHSHI